MKKFLTGLLLLAAVFGMAWLFFYESPAEKNFKKNQAAAQRGDVNAQRRLAGLYLNGEGVKPSTDAALDLYTKAAAAGDAQSAYELAELYIAGKKVPQDFAAAVTYLKAAAGNGGAQAQYELGRFYKEGLAELKPNPAQAAFWWMQAEGAGSAEAASALQDVQLETPDVYTRVKELFTAYQRALRGETEDQLFLAQAYRKGDLLEPDLETAVYWYDKAQTGKLPQAWYELGELYETGEGVTQDKAKALELYTQAADAGYVPAEYQLGKEAYMQAAASDKPDFSVAFGWLKRAADAGNADAQYMLGILYMQGRGTEQSVPQAISSFRRAAEQGHADAQYVLGQSYYKGLGVTANRTAAKKWLQLSADNGNASAKQFLEQIK